MTNAQDIVAALRCKESRDNRKLLDNAAAIIESLISELAFRKDLANVRCRSERSLILHRHREGELMLRLTDLKKNTAVAVLDLIRKNKSTLYDSFREPVESIRIEDLDDILKDFLEEIGYVEEHK